MENNELLRSLKNNLGEWQCPFLIIIARINWPLRRNSLSVKYCIPFNILITLCINSLILQMRNLSHREVKVHVLNLLCNSLKYLDWTLLFIHFFKDFLNNSF